MSDRELLELAARAAGLRVGFEPNRVECGRYDLYWNHVYHQLCWHNKTAGSEYPEPVCWNPLTDDADALRLAVKLRMTRIGEVWVIERTSISEWECDPQAATRRAITRAAAETYRSMP